MRHSLLRTSAVLCLSFALVINSTAITRATVHASTSSITAQQGGTPLPWLKESMAKLETELIGKYGEGQRARIERGLKQVANFWRTEDGDANVFEDFVRTHFAGDQQTLDTVFERFQHNLEQVDGHMQEIGREFRQQSDLDVGAIL